MWGDALDRREISLTLSVGVSIFPEGGRAVEELLRNADAAMYAVKDTGRNNLRVFNEALRPTRSSTV